VSLDSGTNLRETRCLSPGSFRHGFFVGCYWFSISGSPGFTEPQLELENRLVDRTSNFRAFPFSVVVEWDSETICSESWMVSEPVLSYSKRDNEVSDPSNLHPCRKEEG
jgi:hypothetical protein